LFPYPRYLSVALFSSLSGIRADALIDTTSCPQFHIISFPHFTTSADFYRQGQMGRWADGQIDRYYRLEMKEPKYGGLNFKTPPSSTIIYDSPCCAVIGYGGRGLLGEYLCWWTESNIVNNNDHPPLSLSVSLCCTGSSLCVEEIPTTAWVVQAADRIPKII
jgi:hypothetical protein